MKCNFFELIHFLGLPGEKGIDGFPGRPGDKGESGRPGKYRIYFFLN